MRPARPRRRAAAPRLTHAAPLPQSYDAFVGRWSDCLFENKARGKGTAAARCNLTPPPQFGKEATASNKAQQYGDLAGWAAGADAEACAADDMLWEVEEPIVPASALKSKFRQSMGARLARRGGEEAGGTAEEATELAVGALASSFLLRGSTVDVFRNAQEGLLLPGDDGDDDDDGGGGGRRGLQLRLRDAAGAAITPQRALLARGESNLLLLTPNSGAADRSHSVFQFDIEREAVVSRWACARDGAPLPMRDIVADSKAAQLGQGSTFMGLDDNRLVRWDMRSAGGGVQSLMSSPTLGYVAGHDFARGTGFTCMATTGGGDVVVGGADGRVRLYSDSVLRQAKTSFPGIGSPITHVDVTYDGKFVLATTDGYIMVISTVFRDAKGAVKTGFKGKMGSAIAAPRLLRLLPQDVARTGGAPLSKARFTWVTEGDCCERWVSAACGPFSVVWNFRHVKQATAPKTGATECLDYTLIGGGGGRVEDAAQMHDRWCAPAAGPTGRSAHVLLATKGGQVAAFLGEDE